MKLHIYWNFRLCSDNHWSMAKQKLPNIYGAIQDGSRFQIAYAVIASIRQTFISITERPMEISIIDGNEKSKQTGTRAKFTHT